MRKALRVILFIVFTFLSVLMVRLTLPYFSFDDQTAFLRIKQWVINNSFWKACFYTHVITSCFCLVAGFTQFSIPLLKKYPKVHRYVGILYVLVILIASGPSGFVMGIYANGGFTSQAAFVLLSILWWYFTYKAFIHAKRKQFKNHEAFMVRSFALTLSALTLRSWKFLIVMFLRPHPMDVYTLVAWLGWVPNLLIAECYIYAKIQKSHVLSRLWFIKN
ncbi:DUF2306 domain-containing protein [Fulvivirga ligni]|uniref:DUF2306 domain-containing protein n=1 Tax=Fulvivirga ligni TaxID=2904246 RepID=UPI001F3F182D|nr:DUF2306 domain-containing protein [Fulvivirga ligni]UII22305.1 DUF2306 domain-containing protein [Fulvivirga ligni]